MSSLTVCYSEIIEDTKYKCLRQMFRGDVQLNNKMETITEVNRT